MAHMAATRAVGSLSAFLRLIWHEIEPGRELSWNWHLDLIASELERVTEGQIKELIIAVPPRSMKSILVSVVWPCWWWLRRPELEGLIISNTDKLVIRDSMRARSLIQSDTYRQCIEAASEIYSTSMWGLSSEQAEKSNFYTTAGGKRNSQSSGARITGSGGDFLIIDDPIDAGDVVVGSPEQVATRMEEVQTKYDHAWASRGNDPGETPRVTIMQRLAPGDLGGILIERRVPCVVLPMEYDPDHESIHADDPRTEKGELLFPGRFSRKYIDDLKAKPGASRHYAAQYQQQPPPLGGGVFRREWIRYHTESEAEHKTPHYALQAGAGHVKRALKSDCWRVMVSDTALSTRTIADYSVIQIWDVLRHEHRGAGTQSEVSQHTSDAILVDLWRGQVTAPDYEDMLEKMRQRWNPMFTAIEESTASKAIIDRLKRDGIQIKGMKPQEWGGDKVNRAYTASIQMEAGKVYFPHAAPWLADFEAELLNFPGGGHDDMVDTLAYAILLMADRDLWVKPKRKPLPTDSAGAILGIDKLLYDRQENKRSVFSMDNPL